MNTEAAVLASDSLGTAALWHGARRQFQDQKKIFKLRPELEIGVLVYGSAKLAGIPWRRFLEDYASSSTAPISSLDEVVEHFCKYVNEREILTKEIRQKAWRSRIAAIIDDVVYEARYIRSTHPRASEPLTSRVSLAVHRCDQELALFDYLPGRSPGNIDEIRRTFLGEFDDAVRSTERRYGFKLEDEARNEFISLLAKVSCIQADMGDTSGLVFAGFGADEEYPSSIAVKFYGFDVKFYGFDQDNIQMTRADPLLAEPGGGVIEAYSERDVILDFLGLRPPERYPHIEQAWANFVASLATSMSTLAATNSGPGSLSPDTTRTLVEKLARAAQHDTLNNDQQGSPGRPLPRHLISTMPPAELERMSRRLVKLTEFHQGLVPDLDPTVGGPTQTLVLTRSGRLGHPFLPGPRTPAVTP